MIITEQNIKKMDKILKIGFICGFLFMLVVPLFLTNQMDGKISISENRTLAAKPSLYMEDGSFNTSYIKDFENWFNDNVGLRSQFVLALAKIKYNVFNILSNSTDYYLGPGGELNYATPYMIESYAHTNLYEDSYLDEIAASFQIVNDYLAELGIDYYYFQCWDKHSIYPEYFMDTINQYGNISLTDQIVDVLSNRTDVTVVSPKKMLVDEKINYNTYSIWGDATHWTQRGAFLSYQMLMNAININYDNKYKVLQESDYDITVTDQGTTVFGGIHKEDYEENFVIKNPYAYQTNEAPIYTSMWQNKSRTIFINDTVDNDDTLLILGDSYFDSFLVDDLAESFHKTVLIWGNYSEHLKEIVEYYNPALVISENAERCPRVSSIIKASKEIKTK